jgi:hypothetical protein
VCDGQTNSHTGLKLTSPHRNFRLIKINGYQDSQPTGLVNLRLINLKSHVNDLQQKTDSESLLKT